MNRWDRIARAIAVAPVGVLLAPFVGWIMLALLNLTFGEMPRLRGTGHFLLLGLLIGGPPAALLAPIAWFALMERVSFARAVTMTSAASVVGGIIAAHLVALGDLKEASGIATIPGAILGCVAGIIGLRRWAGRTVGKYEHAA